MKKVDFLIIGQGLAGTLLVHDLLEKEYSVTIIDKNLRASASRVAAGLINPVGMKRCIPSFNAHNFLPKAIERYQKLEKKLDVTFLHLMPILRLFSNDEVKHQWQVKYSNTEMHEYIQGFKQANHSSYLKDDFGSASISPSGHLDTNVFLDSSRAYFKTVCNLLEDEFDFSAFIPENPNSVEKTILTSDFQKNERYNVSFVVESGKKSLFTLYLGPLEYDQIKALSVDLDMVMDFGWSFIRPIS